MDRGRRRTGGADVVASMCHGGDSGARWMADLVPLGLWVLTSPVRGIATRGRENVDWMGVSGQVSDQSDPRGFGNKPKGGRSRNV